MQARKQARMQARASCAIRAETNWLSTSANDQLIMVGQAQQQRASVSHYTNEPDTKSIALSFPLNSILFCTEITIQFAQSNKQWAIFDEEERKEKERLGLNARLQPSNFNVFPPHWFIKREREKKKTTDKSMIYFVNV